MEVSKVYSKKFDNATIQKILKISNSLEDAAYLLTNGSYLMGLHASNCKSNSSSQSQSKSRAIYTIV